MRIYFFRLKKTIWLLTFSLVLLSSLALNQAAKQSIAVLSPLLLDKIIIIDAGHGGIDPGVIGVNGSLEKDITLNIAQNLAEILRNNGAQVILSREQDIALGSDKSTDLIARVDLVEQNQADIFISIHGNSFPHDSSSHGAQSFFFAANEQGQILAETIQNELISHLGNTNRQALAHNSAYILKHITVPAAMVEVGFLSNSDEEALLNDEAYQWQISMAIYQGLTDYLANN